MNVTFVAFSALPAIDPRVRKPLGGTETRAWLLAAALNARPDLDVQFAVRTPRGYRELVHRGVRLLPDPDPWFPLYEYVMNSLERRDGIVPFAVRRVTPGLLWKLPLVVLHRALVPRREPTRPHPFFSKLETDLFVTFGNQTISSYAIASAHATGRKAVLMLGSDSDLDERYTADSNFITTYGDRSRACYWNLKQADVIVAQTQQQQEMLKDRFGRSSELLRNPIDLQAWDAAASEPLAEESGFPQRPYVLWVGRAEAEHKRPQLAVELARRLPDVPFVLVMNPKVPEVERRVREAAPESVTIILHVPYGQMASAVRSSRVVINTSHLEGMPNVFLQAAASRVPIVSLEEIAGEFLDASGGGIRCGGDMERMASEVRRLWENEDERRRIGEAGRGYVEREHALGPQVERLAGLLRQQFERPSATVARGSAAS